MFKGICEICGVKTKPSNKKWCSWECILKNYSIDENGCWNWNGSKTVYGYGQVNRNGKVYLLPRYFYEKYNGKIENKLCVLHKCDNRCCVNPNHLFLGTKKDNADDKIEKGRHNSLFGEKAKKAKLKEYQIKEIRKEYANGLSMKKLGKKYKVSSQSIDAIIKKRNWKHVQ